MMSFPARQTLPLLSLLLLLLLAPHAAAQIVDQAAIPACARGAGCAIWQQAQQLCAPPTTPAADKGCFCSSNYLAPFRGGQASGVCDVVCPPADQRALQAYFQASAPRAPRAATAPAAPGTTPAPAPGAAPAATTARAGGAPAAPAPGGGAETVTVTVEDAAPTSRGPPRPRAPDRRAGAARVHRPRRPRARAPGSSRTTAGWSWWSCSCSPPGSPSGAASSSSGAGGRRPRDPAPPALAASDVAPALADRHPVARSVAPPVAPVAPAAWAAGAPPQHHPPRASSAAASARGFHAAGGGGGDGPFGPSASTFYAPRPPFGAAGAVPYSSEDLAADPNRPNSRPGTSHR